MSYIVLCERFLIVWLGYASLDDSKRTQSYVFSSDEMHC